jgi:hypothetical protein
MHVLFIRGSALPSVGLFLHQSAPQTTEQIGLPAKVPAPIPSQPRGVPPVPAAHEDDSDFGASS